MSTKIFNAYKFEGTLLELQAELLKVRKENYALRYKDMEAWLKAVMNKQTEKISITQHRFDFSQLLKTARQSTQKEFFDFSTEAVIYPIEERLFLVQFFRLPGEVAIPSSFKDYHYQNQTDQPEDISDEDWQCRETLWDSIFDTYNTPAEAGFMYEIFGASQETMLALGKESL